MRRGRHVGIAHAEIDDVVASRAGLRLELVDLLKHVWRQPPDSVEIAVHALVPLTPNQDAMPNGWAFEPQKRPPGQDAPSCSFAPLIASFSRFDRCCGRFVGRSLTSRLLVLQIGDCSLLLFRAEGSSELLVGGVKRRR